ncbi:MAG TPA: HAMP domain-containing protein [Caldilineae bacterium]|nr:HAMP domain-containing protein [Caldilineae bacterium]
MRSSLFVKLLGAFVLIIVIYGTLVLVTTRLAATSEFRLYTTRSGLVWARQLAPVLAEYYAQTGSWEGVTAALQNPMGMMMSHPDMMGRGMMGPMMGWGMMERWRGQSTKTGWDMWTMMGQRLILVDASGQVVVDTSGEWQGRRFSPQELAAGVPIMVDGRQVGTLIIAALDTPGAATPAGQFLTELNRSILLAGVISGVVALVLGAILFFHLTAPIRQLQAAARAIAEGKLDHRVRVNSEDELGELAQTFNAMAESLAQAEAQRRHLMADIAHELRTPLSVIQGNLEAMLDGVLPLDAERIASLHEETLLLNRLVADLRLLSLAEAGQLKLERTETDLREVIERAVELMAPRAQEKAIQLEVQVAEDLPWLLIDADRIHQVIGNLISNALRYTPEGGRVHIQAFKGRPPGERGQAVIVQVTDTGSGIAPEDLPHIFDRFYRADKFRSRSSGGSGLGLAIVKYLVEAHGGRVWAESPIFTDANGSTYGTRVSFSLPLPTHR